MSAPAAGALLATGPDEARRLLDQLASAHLLDHCGPDRYRMHDLIRTYAADRAEAEEREAGRIGAVRRLLEWYVDTADAADRLIMPRRPRAELGRRGGQPALRFDTVDEAVSWHEAERANLVAAVQQAEQLRMWDLAWKLPVAALAFYYRHKYGAELAEMARIGLAAAIRLDDPIARASAQTALALSFSDSRRYGRAIGYFRRALRTWKKVDQPEIEEVALMGLAVALRNADRAEQSLPYFQQAIALAERITDSWGLGIALHNLGEAYRRLGRFDEAFDHYDRSLQVRHRLGERHGAAWVLHDKGQANLDLGRWAEAEDCFRRALSLRRDVGDRHGEASTLVGLGHLAYARGEVIAGREHWRAAIGILRHMDPPRADEVAADLVRAGTVRNL